MSLLYRALLPARRPESRVIPELLPIETSAVVQATAADVQARRGAIMLRLWHHVGEGPARAVLFEDFQLAGRPLGLIEAIICTAEQRHWRGRLPRGLDSGSAGWSDEVDRLERAFAYALVEVLGGLAAPMVRRAWRDALRMLLAGDPPTQHRRCA